MKRTRPSGESGAVLIVVLLITLILSVIVTGFVNYQVNDKKMVQDAASSLRAFCMADSGISLALAKISRDRDWQGQDRKVTEWMYNEGTWKFGFIVSSQFRTDGSYNYDVRSTGVVLDMNSNPPRLVAARSVKAYIQCATDYNPDHDPGNPEYKGTAGTHYTPLGNGTEAILWRYFDEYK